MTTSSSEGAHRIQTVRATGSSIALSRASAARSVRRSASSMMMTRHGPDRRPMRRQRREVAGLLDLDRQPLGGDDVDVGVGAVDGGAALEALAAAAAGALEGGGEGPGRHGATRARRAGEQPGVGHGAGVGGRALEGRDRRLLADDVAPDGHGSTTRASRRRFDDLGVDLAPGLGAVDDEVALGVALRHRQVVRADGLVEGVLLRLEPVVHLAATAAALLGADVDDDGEVGDEVLERPTC